MDEIVKAAMAKWPAVPAVYGWLELTARGEWRIKGEQINNQAIREFIGRNYTHDDRGCWYFQNGPQRVFVSLAATPIVYRLDESGRLRAHTGAWPQELRAVLADAAGRLYLETDLGPGLVDSQEMTRLAERIVDPEGRVADETWLARWSAGAGDAYLDPEGLLVGPISRVPIGRVDGGRLPGILGFVSEPRADPPASVDLRTVDN